MANLVYLDRSKLLISRHVHEQCGVENQVIFRCTQLNLKKVSKVIPYILSLSCQLYKKTNSNQTNMSFPTQSVNKTEKKKD